MRYGRNATRLLLDISCRDGAACTSQVEAISARSGSSVNSGSSLGIIRACARWKVCRNLRQSTKANTTPTGTESGYGKRYPRTCFGSFGADGIMLDKKVRSSCSVQKIRHWLTMADPSRVPFASNHLLGISSTSDLSQPREHAIHVTAS